ncbi:MAG: hypothetical protein Q8S03_13160 [Brevundimonas sp.]|nr:hypothetical protein [Brevundimonas sp.]MDP3405638.1 hypothetical protein [Brevundimonas sp.]
MASAAVSGCAQPVKAPFDPGVCFAVERPEGQDVVFNVVARDQAQIELCAARLEEMRVRFNRMGGSRREVTGAFQGQFIFVDSRGVSFSRTLDGARFFALARTGDGRLAVPGAIERGITELGVIVEEAAPPAPPPFPAD